MEMVEEDAVGGGDICRGSDGLAASLPVSSAVDVEVPCRMLPRPSPRRHPRPLPSPAKTAVDAGLFHIQCSGFPHTSEQPNDPSLV